MANSSKLWHPAFLSCPSLPHMSEGGTLTQTALAGVDFEEVGEKWRGGDAVKVRDNHVH